MNYNYKYGNSQYGFNGGYSRGNYQSNRPRKKSGCRLIMKDKDTPIISAWKSQKNGLLALYARPYKGTKLSVSKSGKEWLNLFVTITNRQTHQVTKCSGLFDLQRQRLYLPEFNLIANPKAPNGGYFGKHISKNYR